MQRYERGDVHLSGAYSRSGLVAMVDILVSAFENGSVGIIFWLWTGDITCVFKLACTARNPFWNSTMWCMDCGRVSDPQRRIVWPQWQCSFREVVYFNCRCYQHMQRDCRLHVPDLLQTYDAESVCRTLMWVMHKIDCLCDVCRAGVRTYRTYR